MKVRVLCTLAKESRPLPKAAYIHPTIRMYYILILAAPEWDVVEVSTPFSDD